MSRKQPPKKAAKQGVPAVAGAPGLLRVTAARDGFRRAGRAWPSTLTEVDAAEFTSEQLEALNAEPMLVVEFVPAPPPKAGPPKE